MSSFDDFIDTDGIPIDSKREETPRPRTKRKHPIYVDESPEDGFERFHKLAKESQKNNPDPGQPGRGKDCSFVRRAEHDVANVGKLLWDFFTGESDDDDWDD